MTHVLGTGWAVFQIPRTLHFQQRFTQIITNAACGGVDLLPTYFNTKLNNQVRLIYPSEKNYLIRDVL